MNNSLQEYIKIFKDNPRKKSILLEYYENPDPNTDIEMKSKVAIDQAVTMIRNLFDKEKKSKIDYIGFSYKDEFFEVGNEEYKNIVIRVETDTISSEKKYKYSNENVELAVNSFKAFSREISSPKEKRVLFKNRTQKWMFFFLKNSYLLLIAYPLLLFIPSSIIGLFNTVGMIYIPMMSGGGLAFITLGIFTIILKRSPRRRNRGYILGKAAVISGVLMIVMGVLFISFYIYIINFNSQYFMK